MKNAAWLTVIMLFGLCTVISPQPAKSSPIDSLKIVVRNTDHLFHFSNKDGSFYVGETNAYTHHFLMGYISYRETLFSDYQIVVDGNILKRPSPDTKVIYRPYELERFYKNGITEKVAMPDHVDALLIFLKAPNAKTADFRLLGSDFEKVAHIDTTSSPNRVTLKLKQTVTPYLTVAVEGKLTGVKLGKDDITLHIKLRKMKMDHSRELFVVGAGANSGESMRNAIIGMTNNNRLIRQKKERLESLLQSQHFETSDKRLNKAFGWALCSFDALNMDEKRTHMGKGIYAGYPWFQDYWGRDSFIAMRALIITGQFKLAKETLESFLKYQILKDTTDNYGKVPNRVRPDQQIYNTADATPRFLIEANRYVEYSGDTKFLKDIYPNIKAAILGTIKYRTDKFGFITHGDADTWMDAVGPKGPYSPRGNRADDIQALWMQALQSTIHMCRVLNTKESRNLGKTAKNVLNKVQVNFSKMFVNQNWRNGSDKPVIYDALHKNGQHSMQIRPNALFCAGLLKNKKQRIDAVRQVYNRLTTPYGVMSLDPTDPDYHPFHQFEPLYEQDAAYHSGIIWLWNTGELVSQMTNMFLQDKVYPITQNYADLILRGVSLGTLTELLDALPRNTPFRQKYPDPRDFEKLARLDQMSIKHLGGMSRKTVPSESGTFSQAWSLSEYIRSIYEDYLGLRFLINKGFELKPALPQSITYAGFRSRFHGIVLDAHYDAIQNRKMRYHLDFTNNTNDGEKIRFQDKWMPDPVILKVEPGIDRYVITTGPSMVEIERNGEPFYAEKIKSGWPNLYGYSIAKTFHYLDTSKIKPSKMHFTSQLTH